VSDLQPVGALSEVLARPRAGGGLRWALDATPVRGAHLTVAPLDEEAQREVLWPVAPAPVCGRRRRGPKDRLCEACVLALAGLTTYTRLVAAGRLKEKGVRDG
jgi:hypothetical protein